MYRMLSLNWPSGALGQSKEDKKWLCQCLHFYQSPCSNDSVTLAGLSLVVGLVLYISNINDEMLNRTKSNEAYFSYNYGWSFAFAAISFLLTEVTPPPPHPTPRSRYTPEISQQFPPSSPRSFSMTSSIFFQRGRVQTAYSAVWCPHSGKHPPSTVKCHLRER